MCIVAELRAADVRSSHQFEEDIGVASSENWLFIAKMEFSVRTPPSAEDRDSVRTGVVVALGALGDKRAIEPLEAMLKAEKNENVRRQIEQALQRLLAVQPDKQ